MDDLISVIVPVYKVEAYLNHCVESIVNQTYINLEIILVDDGSPDRCPKMCDAWAARDKRIRVIHKENGGLSDARNAGIQIASGKYMGFVDADDWIAAEMYERLLNVLRKDDSDIAACSVVMVWEDGDWEKLLTVKETALLDSDQAEKALMEETLLKNPVWYKLYKTASVRDIPFEKGKQHEDVYWSYQAVGKAQKVSIIDYVGYFYRQRTSSIMGAPYSMKRLDVIEAYERRYHYLAENFPSLEKRARINIIENCVYHGQMVLLYLTGEEQRQAMTYLNEVKERYHISRSEYRNMKVTHRLWLDLARVSLTGVCRIKNSLRIGK